MDLMSSDFLHGISETITYNGEMPIRKVLNYMEVTIETKTSRLSYIFNTKEW